MSESNYQKQHFSQHSKYTLKIDARIRKVREIFKKSSTGNVILDVGCADGAILKPFVEKNTIYGLDISDTYTKTAIKNGYKEARVFDIASDKIPFDYAKFDIVFTGETIEHLINTDFFLHEINRVLKIDGTLILTFPNIRTVMSLLMMTAFNMPPRFSARYRAPHYRDFTTKSMRYALRNNGFSIKRILGTSLYLPYIGDFGANIATILPSWADQVIVVARKTTNSSYHSESVIDAYGAEY